MTLYRFIDEVEQVDLGKPRMSYMTYIVAGIISTRNTTYKGNMKWYAEKLMSTVKANKARLNIVYKK